MLHLSFLTTIQAQLAQSSTAVSRLPYLRLQILRIGIAILFTLRLGDFFSIRHLRINILFIIWPCPHTAVQHIRNAHLIER